ncbi:hypothetical protein FGO68_gene10274 [Halteria grandinella]|uniref:Uncharacterized protein n=1 Tax=Halteria grandinella TaxID=5974 RepID=A0A8J8T3R9_HALGN|nr:hypothetical protein FGO68_gene10274 [Halteria grandinella]
MSRPTELQFRSPKQKTPDFYLSSVTTDGSRLLESRSKNSLKPYLNQNDYDMEVITENMMLTASKAGDPLSSFKRVIQTSQERKASFQTSQPRFPQYDQWAKKTSMFLGPGVYDDHEKYRRLTQAPCTAVYRQSHLGKHTSGQDGYQIVGSNCLMYEPSFDKSKEARTEQQQSATSNFSMKAVFNQQNLAHLKQNFTLTRNGLLRQGNLTSANPGIANAYAPSRYPMIIKPNGLSASRRRRVEDYGMLTGGIQRQSDAANFEQECKTSEGCELAVVPVEQKDNRPSTSYSYSRRGLSTQSQSRNHTKTNFNQAVQSQGSNIQESQSRNTNYYTPLDSNLKSLKGHEIKNIGLGAASMDNLPLEYQNYHQPRENESLQRSQRDTDPLISGSFPSGLGMLNNRQQVQSQQNLRRPFTVQSKRTHSQTKRIAIIPDLKKSFGMLQAYGEYNRFVIISKQFIKRHKVAPGFVQKQRKSKSGKGRKSAKLDDNMQIARGRFEHSPSADKKYEEMNRILNEKLSNQRTTSLNDDEQL